MLPIGNILAPAPLSPGAKADLQPHADRPRHPHLLPDAVAAGAGAEPAGEPGAGEKLSGKESRQCGCGDPGIMLPIGHIVPNSPRYQDVPGVGGAGVDLKAS